jgi:hypothetical protein
MLARSFGAVLNLRGSRKDVITMTRSSKSGFGRTLGTLKAVGIAVDAITGGYWILKSNGGMANCNAPWYGSLTGKVPEGQTVTGIAAD